MLVYGDHDERVATADYLARLTAQAAALGRQASGIGWHQDCVALFISAAGLLQGIADAEFEAGGHDELSDAQSRISTWLRALAEAIDRSWRSGFDDQRAPEVPDLPALPPSLSIRSCEGYAYYALYPELYLTAARRLTRGATVIGLRSIGTGLAALTAAACDAGFVCTLRPVGEPYARQVVIGPALEARLLARRDGIFALVDEGPGQSGSSFAGAADALERLGIDRDRIVFLPSHAGDPGGHAPEGWPERWRASQRLVANFDEVFLADDAPAPLARWFEDVTGPVLAPLTDLAGGRWRDGVDDVPADPGREARKYLLESERGHFLLKFVGIGPEASDKLVRAQVLGEAGFAPMPLALRYGFLVERWLSASTPEPAATWRRVAPYLAFRSATFPASAAGASLSALVAMARYNVATALGEDGWSAAWSDARLGELERRVRPVHVDGRMHRWEWIADGGQILKTDAIDHARGHDLIGPQDIAWDVAGAIVELTPSGEDAAALIDAVVGGRQGGIELVHLMIRCYIGFQLGWWSFGSEERSRDTQRRFYRERWQALVAATKA